MHPLTITRTVYDPATRDFVFDSAESKALPNIRQWINNKNPVIYWYVLRVDNQSELQLDQWAIELYTHQALNITEAYIDGIDRCFELKKREHDLWTEKYVLSISKQLGIPIVGKGTRRVFFKVDINCREGLMHEYGISGRFIAHGVEPVDIREKAFQYSCKVGEFKQIFDNNPDEASLYAEKRLSNRYSSNDIQLFTNSFRMIHDLYRYCHSGPVQKDKLMHKLHLLYANFEMVPDIAKDKINPLLYDGIRELELVRNIDNFKPRYILLCDSLVELLHIEVMGTNPDKGAIAAQENEILSNRTDYVNGDEKISRQDGRTVGISNRECPVCGNIIDPSNKSLLCKCGARFCHTCESWFREPRKPGESPLCKRCFAAETDEKIRTERERALAQEAIRLKTAEKVEREREKEAQRQWQEEQKLRKEREKQERLLKEQEEQRRKEAELKAQEEARLRAAEEAENKRKEEAQRQWQEEQKLRKEQIKTAEEAKRKEEQEQALLKMEPEKKDRKSDEQNTPAYIKTNTGSYREWTKKDNSKLMIKGILPSGFMILGIIGMLLSVFNSEYFGSALFILGSFSVIIGFILLLVLFLSSPKLSLLCPNCGHIIKMPILQRKQHKRVVNQGYQFYRECTNCGKRKWCKILEKEATFLEED